MFSYLLLAIFVWLGGANPARAGTPVDPEVGAAPVDRAFKASDKSQAEKDAEQKKAEEAREREAKAHIARVIVLKWPETSTDYTDETVRRNVRSRIARPDAMFFPDVDLYQNGRKVPDRTVIPAQQPAIVPDSNIPTVMAAVNSVSGLSWNAMSPADWGLKAQELQRIANLIWFVDRVNLREPLFLLYAQIGKAAENQNNPAPPFYEQVGNQAVNYYWYLAATLAYQEPALMSKLTDQDLAGSVGYYLTQLQNGAFPSFKVDFSSETAWDPDSFNKTYEVDINGIPVEPDVNGQLDVFLGRTDINLKRKDTGYGLSERLESLKIEEKIYFVLDAARKKMSKDFINQLFLHKNECSPELDGAILTYLAVYQKLHDKAEIYIAVPETGNPNKTWIWRYDKNAAQLNLVGGGPDAFPVHFALVASSGLLYNGAAVNVPSSADVNSLTPSDLQTQASSTAKNALDLGAATVPFNFELRLHYNRLMVNLGSEFGLNAAKDSSGWSEYYQTNGHNKDKNVGVYDMTGDCKKGECTVNKDDQLLHATKFNRYLYVGAGIVLGRDAGIGFGPRFAARFGWTNLPHALQTTGHFGWAIQPPVGNFGGRFRPLVDLDLRGGVSIALKRSLQIDQGNHVKPVFGATLGVGFTF